MILIISFTLLKMKILLFLLSQLLFHLLFCQIYVFHLKLNCLLIQIIFLKLNKFVLLELSKQELKDPPDGIVLDIWVLLSRHIISKNIFCFTFCLVVWNTSCGYSSSWKFLLFILNIVLVLFFSLQILSFFNCVFVYLFNCVFVS